ncbi:DUF4352 domain-containing protein [Candidatus Dojkabacteria bacterium]|nr:DUF4352 domain-containing protein [Candidatus Dojkabacteria bacterium]
MKKKIAKAGAVIAATVASALLLSACGGSDELSYEDFDNEVVAQNQVIEYQNAVFEEEAVKVTIKDVTWDYMSEDFELTTIDPEESQQMFVKVDIMVENTGTGEFDLSDASFKFSSALESNISQAYEFKESADSYDSKLQDGEFDITLQPGETVEFSLYYKPIGGLLEASSESYKISFKDNEVPLTRYAE